MLCGKKFKHISTAIVQGEFVLKNIVKVDSINLMNDWG